MGRYEKSNIVNNSRKTEQDGTVRHIRRLETTLYPEFRTGNMTDTYIVSREGDRLDLLAKEFYGDESYWYAIARVNNIGHASLFIPPGTILTIPSIPSGMEIIEAIKSYNDMR